MKTLPKIILFALLIIGILVAFNWQKVNQLHSTITLFDEDKIVENFMHMDRIFPAIELISTNSPQPFEDHAQSLPVSYDYGGQQRSTNEFLETTATTALLVLHNDIITHESYYQGTTAEDKRISWSVAKSFLSALFGIAVDRGEISNINAQVTDYVPELIGTGYDGATIKNVLQMSSGVGFNEDYQDFSSDINKFGRMLALGGSLDDFAASLKNERTPGTYLHYVSIDTHVLGMVLRKATGQTVADYFTQNLWSKLHPEADAYFITDSHLEPMVLGGLNMRTRDFARMGKLYKDFGRWNGEQIISEAWVKDSTTPDEDHLRPGKRDSSETTLGYGYQWWIPENADQEFLAIGIYDQFIYVNQRADVVIVKNSAYTNFMDNDFESANETIALFREIVKSLDGDQ